MSEYIVRETGYPGTLKTEIVGELVRCRDCRYYEQNDDDYEGEQGEDSWGVCRNTGAGMMRCGYCSDGERKDDV